MAKEKYFKFKGKIIHVGGNSDYDPFLKRGIPALSTWVRGGQRYGVHTEEDSIYVITPRSWKTLCVSILWQDTNSRINKGIGSFYE